MTTLLQKTEQKEPKANSSDNLILCSLQKFNAQNFKDDMSNQILDDEYDHIFQATTVDQAYNRFKETFYIAQNRHCPIIKGKTKINYCHYITGSQTKN